MFHLVVVEPFGSYAKGDRVSDPTEVAKILESSNAGHVVKVAADVAPAQ